MPYISDTHCDTLGLLSSNSFLCGSRAMNLSLPRLIRGNVRCQCFAVCVHPDENGLCRSEGEKLIKRFGILCGYTDSVAQIKTKTDLSLIASSDKIGAILTLEGADMLENDFSCIRKLFEYGVRIFAFTWNNSNFLSGGIGENAQGLSDSGFRMLSFCEENGVLVDVSHISEKGFWDISGRAAKPFIASHSNAKRLCRNKRNLDDAQLSAIKDANGTVGINFYPPFLSDSGEADIDDVIRHIEYVSAFIGTAHVSIGSDFDGTDGLLPKGLEHPGKMQSIPERLLRLNYSEAEVNAICHGNIERVLFATLPEK